jgi:hypothetical protein
MSLMCNSFATCDNSRGPPHRPQGDRERETYIDSRCVGNAIYDDDLDLMRTAVVDPARESMLPKGRPETPSKILLEYLALAHDDRYAPAGQPVPCVETVCRPGCGRPTRPAFGWWRSC